MKLTKYDNEYCYASIILNNSDDYENILNKFSDMEIYTEYDKNRKKFYIETRSIYDDDQFREVIKDLFDVTDSIGCYR